MTTEALAPPPRSQWLDAFGRYLALAIGFAIMAGPTLVSLGQQSWSTELGAHGPIVLATGIWLLSTSLPKGALRTGPLGWRGLPLVLLAMPVYAFGRAYDFISLEAFAVFVAMLGIAWRILRPEAIRTVGFPLLYFGFLIPPPGWVVDTVTAPLQHFISWIVTHGLKLLGYPIANSGVAITIGPYQMLVEQACSGMNSIVGLTAIMMFYIYVLHHSHWRYALLLMLLILPVAVFTNLLRVTALVLITHYFGEAAAQGFLHTTTGIALFAVALVLTIGLDVALRAIIRRRDMRKRRSPT